MTCSCGKPASILSPVPLCEQCALETALSLLSQCQLSDQSVRALIQSELNIPVKTQEHFSASDIADETGVSAQKIGRISNKYQLKCPDFGEWRLTKATNSNKQIESFFYNAQGRKQIMKLLKDGGYT
ncbi:hypothetical protein VQ7734_00080 [Vibrio quintilis]|uniref:Uncharacterized protein n=2 Tax=Vibrio quintilis TaxID=1117707 RepID=A0A1M7YPE5_9VIBR|nr:hypothetical protein VQ7734_00080 [Vibrio quintilis]